MAERMRSGRGWLQLLTCLLVVGLLSVAVPEFDPDSKDVRRAGVGTWVQGDGYRVRVTSVAVAHGLVGGSASSAPVAASDGAVWVVVTWQVAAERDNVTFGSVHASTRGRTYASRDTNAGVGHTVTPAGFTDECEETFHLPADLLARTRLEPAMLSGGLSFYRSQPSIDLGLAADTEVVDTAAVQRCRREVTR